MVQAMAVDGASGRWRRNPARCPLDLPREFLRPRPAGAARPDRRLPGGGADRADPARGTCRSRSSSAARGRLAQPRRAGLSMAGVATGRGAGPDRVPDLPLIAGRGAPATCWTLALLIAAARRWAAAAGLVRVGERRWDLVLDRDQRILLPERGRCGAGAGDRAARGAARFWTATWPGGHAHPRPADLRLNRRRGVDLVAIRRYRAEGRRMTDLYHIPAGDARTMRKAAIQRGVVADPRRRHLEDRLPRPALRRARRVCEQPTGIGALAGQAAFRVIGAATTRSRGVRFGEIAAMQETERAIRTAVQAAQKMAGCASITSSPVFPGGGPGPTGWPGQDRPGRPAVAGGDMAACWRPARCPITATGARCCTPSR